MKEKEEAKKNKCNNFYISESIGKIFFKIFCTLIMSLNLFYFLGFYPSQKFESLILKTKNKLSIIRLVLIDLLI